jgi:carbonic anhydrase
MDHSYLKLLIHNKKWSKEQIKRDPEYFKRLVNVQKPEFLWIGCSDSRVPPHKITQTQPGEIFIHRNIANVVANTDLNILSVIQYAVEVLEVNHIIVCGHYGCGGVKAALSNDSFGLMDNWLRNIKDVYRFNRDELESYFDGEQKLNRLVELNIEEQVKNLAKNAIIQKSWKKRNLPELHGWVYDLNDGIINPLMDVFPNSVVDSNIYKYDV